MTILTNARATGAAPSLRFLPQPLQCAKKPRLSLPPGSTLRILRHHEPLRSSHRDFRRSPVHAASAGGTPPRFIVEQDARHILEIGFYHGKSSAHFEAVLEELGRGHLVTIDRNGARQREPNVEKVLAALGLTHRVMPVYAVRSYAWKMAKLIRTEPRPQFDLCYFDGGHTWDVTGFGFLLVDLILRPGGWIVFDDLYEAHC